MSFQRLCHDLRIPFEAAEDSSKVQPGWVGLTCPYCHSHGPHLGVNLEGWGTNCWICGPHPIDEVLSRITGRPLPQIWELIREHRGKSTGRRSRVTSTDTNAKIKINRLRFPSGCGEITKSHRRYLKSRRFDPDHLVQEWGILGTGPAAFLDKINFSYRLVAPIRWKGQVVSFQSRDVTGRSKLKYLTCPPHREVHSHKDILYGQPDRWGEVGICVEGITDVWRLGPLAFATFGVQLRSRQVLVMVKQFKRVVILFDAEEAAQVRARKLASRLRGAGIEVPVETVDTDPADLTDQEAQQLVRQLTCTTV